jgi:hypothetical protein
LQAKKGSSAVRYIIFFLLVATVPIPAAEAGPIAHMFEGGYDMVPWGISYLLSDERALFGIARPRMRVRYFLDDTNSVSSVALTFPYSQRQKLLGMLIVSFGPYQRMFSKGISTYYVWKRDDGIGIVLAATLDPTYGILSLGISGPNSELTRHGQADCADKPSTHKSSK